MTDRELMQQALSVLCNNVYPRDGVRDNRHLTPKSHVEIHQQTIDALRERLAQPEQEPLEYWNAVEGWVKIDEVREHFDAVGCGTIYKTAGEGRAPLYTTPPPCSTCEALARTVMLDQTSHDTKRQWVGLTVEDMAELRRDGLHSISDKHFFAIEAKLKEKNTI